MAKKVAPEKYFTAVKILPAAIKRVAIRTIQSRAALLFVTSNTRAANSGNPIKNSSSAKIITHPISVNARLVIIGYFPIVFNNKI